MIKLGFIKKGLYFDSVSLMNISGELNRTDGVEEASVIMGTEANKAILKMSEMYLPDFDQAGDTDLLVSLKLSDSHAEAPALARLETLLQKKKQSVSGSGDKRMKSLDAAHTEVPGLNTALISVSGKYAASLAMEALEKGLHVMLFSDNVSVEDEIRLKKIALEKDLLLMGPDCGTSIINGIPLAFANVVSRGNIGIVAASGTGLQEVSCLISEAGGGISQAIGTGGRDVKKQVGGMMFLRAFKALCNDSETSVITLISKPPDEEVLQKINDEIKRCSKTVACLFIGASKELTENSGCYQATSLHELALISLALSRGLDPEKMIQEEKINTEDKIAALKSNLNPKGKWMRGLFSGGTLCDEAQLLLSPQFGPIGSNTPLSTGRKLEKTLEMDGHCIIDLGDDEFTAGRSHPMIDFSLRNKVMLAEAKKDEVRLILFDLVLGYGSNPDPLKDLLPVVTEIRKKTRTLMVCSVTGTSRDPQQRNDVVAKLSEAGVLVMHSNAAASLLTAEIIKM